MPTVKSIYFEIGNGKVCISICLAYPPTELVSRQQASDDSSALLFDGRNSFSISFSLKYGTL